MLPHRLELALLELQGGCKSVEDVYNILHLIWKTYHFYIIALKVSGL